MAIKDHHFEGAKFALVKADPTVKQGFKILSFCETEEEGQTLLRTVVEVKGVQQARRYKIAPVAEVQTP